MGMEIIVGIFGFVLTVLGTLLISYFKDMKNDIKAMSVSMGQMNVKLEKVITDQSWHNREIAEIKDRITKLEDEENHGR